MEPTDEAKKRMAIAKRVASAYAELEEIESLAVAGSTARGNADDLSDIDIWMTYSSLPKDKDRQRIIDSLDESGNALLTKQLTNGMRRAESMAISGIDIGLFPGSNDDLLSVGSKMEQHLGKPSEKGLADFHDCVVLYDPKGLYDVVKARLANYPIELGTKVLRVNFDEGIRICTREFPRALRNENWMQALESRSNVQEAVLRIAFVLNRDYFPRVKDAQWLLPSLDHLPKDFSKRMTEFACDGNVHNGHLLMVELLTELAELTMDIWPDALENDLIPSLRSIPYLC